MYVTRHYEYFDSIRDVKSRKIISTRLKRGKKKRKLDFPETVYGKR